MDIFWSDKILCLFYVLFRALVSFLQLVGSSEKIKLYACIFLIAAM